MAKPFDFGDIDSSIKIQATLTSQAQAEADGATIVGAPDFGANGMLARPAAVNGGCWFDLSAHAAELVNGGQITLYLEKSVISIAEITDGVNDNGSNGVTPASDNYLFSTEEVAGDEFRAYKRSNQRVLFTDGNVGSFEELVFECATLPDVTKITFGWDVANTIWTVWLDDVLRHTETMTAVVAAGFFDRINIGMRYDDTNSCEIGRILYALISTAIPSVRKVSKMALAGDSFFARAGDDFNNTLSQPFNDSKIGIWLNRYLSRQQSEHFSFTNAAVDGKRVLATHPNSLDSNKAAVVAGNPNVVVVNCTVNDVQQANLATIQTYFETDYQAFIDYLFSNGVEHVLLMNGPPVWGDSTVDTTPNREEITWCNGALQGIADADPRITLIDVFTAIGGFDLTPSSKETAYVRGALNNYPTPARNDIHPSSFGNKFYADIIRIPLFNALGIGSGSGTPLTANDGNQHVNCTTL